MLGELSSCCGPDRPIQVARELTKRHEEQVGPTVEAALAHFQQTRPQGEFTLVLGGATPMAQPAPSDAELTEQLQQLMAQGVSASDAARQLAATTGLSPAQALRIAAPRRVRLKKINGFFAASLTTTALEFWRGRPADASALPWRTKLATASSLQIGSVRLVPLPTGFLVGISLVLGVISGGSVAAVLMPEQQETNLDP